MSIYDSTTQNEAQDGLVVSTDNHSNLVANPTVVAYRQERQAWIDRSEQLADWVLANLAIRTDVYGKHYVRKDGASGRCIIKEPLERPVLLRHFSKSDPIVGVFTTSVDDLCRFLVIDIDCHDGNSQVAKGNHQFAVKLYSDLEQSGFAPLLLDSGGKGGFHLLVHFTEPVPARHVRSLGRWLVRDHQDFGLKEPEVFPKQDSINGKYGNFVRVFGKHHKRSFYTKVWDGQTFVGGREAIDLILGNRSSSVHLIPKKASRFQPPKSQRPSGNPTPGKAGGNWWLKYKGDLRSLDLASLLESEGFDLSVGNDGECQIECPWAEQHTTGEITATIKEGSESEVKFPAFHCFHDHCSGRSLQALLERFDKHAVDAHCRVKFGKDSSTIDPSNPFKTATTFHDELRTTEGRSTLFFHDGSWHGWDGQKYVEISDADIRAQIWRWLASCSCWSKATKTEDSKLIPFVPNRSQVTGTIDALHSVANLSKDYAMPCWLSGDGHSDSQSIVAFRNGLLDVEDFLESGQPELLKHSPSWFSGTCLPHRYDSTAECPVWLNFLDEVFEGDQDRVESLAQWFGYNLTLDTRQQKFAMLVGPPRSGKGTTMAVLAHVLGQDNIANPSLTSLGNQFGLASLIGKQAAIVGDGHLGRHSDSIAVLERLKSIVGCDPQNIARKFRSELTNVTINARFTVSVNEIPRLPDASAALRSRLLLLPFNKSFEGREDVFLFDKLIKEIPGITNWALNGLRSLRQVGKFVQPKSGQAILGDFVRFSSPIRAFIDDCCEIGSDQSIPTNLLQSAWDNWCDQNRHEAGSVSSFGIRLRAVVPNSDKKRVRDGNSLSWHYKGISLKPDVAEHLRLLRRQSGGM